jgi:hypothetical protein
VRWVLAPCGYNDVAPAQPSKLLVKVAAAAVAAPGPQAPPSKDLEAQLGAEGPPAKQVAVRRRATLR